MRALTDHIEEVKGKRVLLRLDLNVPIVRDVAGALSIADDFRIKQALPTIEILRKAGAKIIILSHIESPETDSLELVAAALREFFPVNFVKEYVGGQAASTVDSMKEGDVILFENLRHNAGEKENGADFSLALASYGDFFVNDAFSVSHREHASIVGVPMLFMKQNKAFAGPLLVREISALSKAFSPAHPFLFILGGAKFETKLCLIEKFLDKADSIFIGGALANDVLKARGFEVGQSLVSSGVDISTIATIAANEKIIAPMDVLVENHVVKNAAQVLPTDKILDAGPETTEVLLKKIAEAKYIVWNGPFGKYQEGFNEPTSVVGHAIADRTAAGLCESLIGGGDTLATVAKVDLEKFSFVSTGGGAMLDFLASGTLPGVEVLG